MRTLPPVLKRDGLPAVASFGSAFELPDVVGFVRAMARRAGSVGSARGLRISRILPRLHVGCGSKPPEPRIHRPDRYAASLLGGALPDGEPPQRLAENHGSDPFGLSEPARSGGPGPGAPGRDPIAPDPMTEEFLGTPERSECRSREIRSENRDREFVPGLYGVKKGRGCVGTEKGH